MLFTIKWQHNILSVFSFFIKEPRPVDEVCNNKILLNLGNLMISIGYPSQRLSFLM
jgi:hypothetical protein